MAGYELEKQCSCGSNLIYTTADDDTNSRDVPATTCPACRKLKRIWNPTPEEGDVIGFIHDGEQVQGSVMAIGHSGTIRVRGVGVVDIEPDQVIEILEDAGGTNGES